MTPIIDFTNPLAILTALVLYLLILFLGRHTKKSIILGIFLFAFLGIIIAHTVEMSMSGFSSDINIKAYAISIAVDFVFIFLSFFSYLWIDDIEAKEMKKRSVDNSLEWFWSKV